MSGMVLDRNYLRSLSNEAARLDELIGQSSSPTAGKRAFINRLVNESTVNVDSVVDYVSNMSDVVSQIAFMNKMVKTLNDKFGAQFDAYIDAQVAAQPKVETSFDEVTELIRQRKDVANKWSAVKAVWPVVHGDPNDPDYDISDIPEPKKMTGLRGLRGPRPLSNYQYSLNGNALTGEDNKLKTIAAQLTKKDKDDKTVPWTAADLRSFFVQSAKAEGTEFDVKSAPDIFSFTLPNGNVLSASKVVDEEDEDDDEPDLAESVPEVG